MSDPLLEVQNLKVVLPTRKGRLTAVDEVSFSLAAGEVLGLVGESGAGKSLTGAAIIGLLEPPSTLKTAVFTWKVRGSTHSPMRPCAA